MAERDVLLATLQRHLHLVFTRSAFQPQHDLLSCFRLDTRSQQLLGHSAKQGVSTFLWKTGLV